MMETTRYFIKVTATANEDNENFKNEVKTYFYGKGTWLTLNSNFLVPYDINNGYKRKCDAIRASKFWIELNEKSYIHWTYTTEIICYTI